MNADAKLLPEEMKKGLEPLVSQKVNSEFLKNPNRTINSDYIRMISPETISKLSDTQTVNPATIDLMSIPQLKNLHPSVLADYIIGKVNISKPLTQQELSENLLYFLEPKKGYEGRNEKIRSFEQTFLPQLKIKVNATFKLKPNMSLDPSYVKYLDPNNLKKIKPTANIQPSVIESMDDDQLTALPKEVFARYLVTTWDLLKPKGQQNFPEKITDFITENREETLKEFLKQLQEKVNTSVSSNISKFVNSDYLELLTPENLNTLAEYIVHETDLEKPIKTQKISQRMSALGYDNDQEFMKTFTQEFKEKINRQFTKYPNWKLDPSYIGYISIETIKNLKLTDNQKTNATTILNMSDAQLQAFEPETLRIIIQNPTMSLSFYEKFAQFADKLSPEQITVLKECTRYIPTNILQKMNVKQIEALNVNKLGLSQLNGLLETNNQEIILSVLKNISDLMTLFKTSSKTIAETTAQKVDTFLDSLSAQQLQELATESKDAEVKTMSQTILNKI